jgi:hypothetical protein
VGEQAIAWRRIRRDDWGGYVLLRDAENGSGRQPTSHTTRPDSYDVMFGGS